MAARLSLVCLLLPTLALAAPPTLTTIAPHGLERGKTTPLFLSGANLTASTRLQLPFPAKQEPIELPFGIHTTNTRILNITPEASVPVGIYPVRAVTTDGVSAISFLAVDALPTAFEAEDNNTPDKAQNISVPSIINGTCAGGDVDFYRFAAKKGQRLVIETETGRLGSAVVPQLRLTDEKLRFLAADDSQSQRGECRILLNVPADGAYILEFSDTRYRGGNPPFYRIKIGEFDVADELFPLGGRRGDMVTFTLRGGTLANEISFHRSLRDAAATKYLYLDGLPLKPGMLSPEAALGDYPERIWAKHGGGDPKQLDMVAPVTINGRLEAPGDTDRFQLPVAPGQKYRFAVQAYLLGSNLDGVLRITDQAGKQLALVDDVAVPSLIPGQPPFNNPDPSVEVAVPDGVNLLVAELRDQRKRGGINFTYRLAVEPIVPDFLLQVTNPEVNVPRSGSVLLTINVIRRGYAGPIQLKTPDLPPGFTMHGGSIAPNATTGVLTLSATSDLKLEPASFTIEGIAENLKRAANASLVVGKDPSAPLIVQQFSMLAVAPTNATAFNVQGPDRLEVVKGYPTPVPVKLTCAPVAEKLAIELTGALPAVPNVLTYQPGTSAAGANGGSFTLTVPVAGPEGASSFVVQGKAKINNVDVTVVSAAFPINVVRPFTVAGPDGVTLTPGQTTELKVTVARRGPFKDAVTLRLDGLPAGVTLAEPLAPLPGDKKEVVVRLKVDPKITVVKAVLTLNASATVNGAAFAHPPVTVNSVVKK